MGEGLKRCFMCDQAKPISEYTRNRAKDDGLEINCKKCAAVKRKKYRKNRARGLYIVESGGFHKIGITINLKNRMAVYRADNQLRVSVVFMLYIKDKRDAQDVEHELLSEYKKYRLRGGNDWMMLSRAEVARIISRLKKLGEWSEDPENEKSFVKLNSWANGNGEVTEPNFADLPLFSQEDA